MSGFCVELWMRPMASSVPPLELVDLGSPDLTGKYRVPGVRAAWSRWHGSRQLAVSQSPSRLLWIEGHPDRMPAEGEELTRWLEGRSGSFRGFEIHSPSGQPMRFRAFVDPLGTRPVYYMADRDRVLFADKLATLALNSTCAPAVQWPAVLESLTIGVLYSADTSLENARQMAPGELIEAGAGGEWSTRRFALPADAAIEPDRVHRDPAGTLRRALAKAVAETWRCPDSVLLLSGGLDSRFALAVAGPDRSVLTVTPRENRESRVARLVAESCQARFYHFPCPSDHYFHVLRRSHLITGCRWEPWEAHHLGLASHWRQQGFRGLTHAYHCDSLLKGNRIFPRQKRVPSVTPLHSIMGDRAICYAQCRSFRWHPQSSELVYGTLSATGQDVARQRLRQLASELEPVVEDGLELTVERQFHQRVAAGHSYPILLSWMEEQDVYSPIYHPAPWSWAKASRPADRFRGRAFRQALLEMDHPASLVIDANTGKPISAARRDWGGLIRNLPGLHVLREWRDRMRHSRLLASPKPGAEEGSWPLLAPLFRSPEGLRIIEEGHACLPPEFFNMDNVRRAVGAFAGGDDHYLETVLDLSAAGRWARFCAEGPATDERDLCWRAAFQSPAHGGQ